MSGAYLPVFTGPLRGLTYPQFSRQPNRNGRYLPMPQTVLGGLSLFVVTVVSEVSRHLMLDPNLYRVLPQASAQLLNIVLTPP